MEGAGGGGQGGGGRAVGGAAAGGGGGGRGGQWMKITHKYTNEARGVGKKGKGGVQERAKEGKSTKVKEKPLFIYY